MNKENWKQHIETSGELIIRPTYGGNYDVWKARVFEHKQSGCAICKARARQWRANDTARARHDAYTSCGMVRVRGSQGGVYYE